VTTYRRVWIRATRTVVVVGCLGALVVWCLASRWTFAVAMALAWGLWRTNEPDSSSELVRMLRSRAVAASVVEDREWRYLRLLPALVLAGVGWSMLLGAAGAGLLLVDAAFALPILAGGRHDRWPDGRDVGHVPDTVEELAPTGVEGVVGRGELAQPASSGVSSAAPSRASVSWPGPRTLMPDLDDEELLHAWDSSTRALELDPGPAALLRIVAARARYLDALAERDPEGLARRIALGQPDDWTSFDSPA
jgi:hypothetical protein